MKRKKTITLKDPRLQKVRNNLRLLLLKWGSRQWNQLFDECDKLERDGEGRLKQLFELSIREKNEIDILGRKMRDIRHIIDHSICKCTVCSASDKDMTYNPEQKRWFCVDCYQQLQAHYKGKEESVLFP